MRDVDVFAEEKGERYVISTLARIVIYRLKFRRPT